ncbi:hypothetical protein O181_010184 [Austropuccinia psidii MF-1]|uniref:Uncharacterized protein n=1 Tax=Austropuccinia psidii MF-1 TaxID=1389203 RepID=A0A9Q3GKL0_9BASI|nr:hypothetical protein [Austropuccinia psidii MF-1]
MKELEHFYQSLDSNNLIVRKTLTQEISVCFTTELLHINTQIILNFVLVCFIAFAIVLGVVSCVVIDLLDVLVLLFTLSLLKFYSYLQFHGISQLSPLIFLSLVYIFSSVTMKKLLQKHNER